MIILDENFLVEQREQLQKWNISFRQIGFETGRKGMKDDEIIPFLLEFRNPTFFSLDAGFYRRHLRHARYCVVFIDGSWSQSAKLLRQFIKHKQFDTQAKRMGTVVQISAAGIKVWSISTENEVFLEW